MAEINNKYARIKDEIRKKIDIVSLIEHYVPLKQTGNGYIGLCPFHNEKTPSFSVQPNADNGGFYHCFGCQKSGDAFTFLMEKEGLSFIDAMKSLAREYGILWDIEEDKENCDYNTSTRANLLKATEFATNFFYNEMTKSAEAKNYLKERGILGETAKEFRLGFAPNYSNKLLKAAQTNGIAENILIQAALVKRNEIGIFDFFRNRIIFPIFDSAGHPVAFGGRAFGDEKPKYINSTNTSLYDKSRIFYGYFQSQKEIKTQKTVIIVEGYMDMLALYQNGIKNAVAPCGTSFSEEHAKFLSRIAQKAVIVLDGDEAGINGAKKIVEKLLPFEIDIRYVLIPENQDPDEFIKSENGKENFLRLIKNAQDGFSFLINWIERQYNVFEPSGKSKAIREICKILSTVKSEIMLSDFITILSIRYKISMKEIRKSIKNYNEKQNYDATPPSLLKDKIENENYQIFHTEQGKAIHIFFCFPQILQEYMYEISHDFFTDPIINKLYYFMREEKFDRKNFLENKELSEREKAFLIILASEKLTELDKESNKQVFMSEKEAKKQIAAKINKFKIIEIQKENEFLKNKIREESNEEKKKIFIDKITENLKEITVIKNKKRSDRNE
ncbi:MAG: DNA primase [Chitinispirillales bacterium]|jgi:DNA primase|nr:DNA primase [Chitinispirillales bacterium]